MINFLSAIEQEILLSDASDYTMTMSRKLLEGNDTVYSYIVYNIYKADALYCWRVKYMVSDTNRFNTILIEDAITDIINIVENNRNEARSKVAGYKQPPIELIFELYDPLISKLAYKQSNKWRVLDYEDAYQMCALVILTLYRKGYYLHKRLIEKSYNNYVLLQLRKEKDTPVVFILWGNFAKTKKRLITNPKHLVIESSHPSPFSCNYGFFGSRPFSRTNEFLKKNNIKEIDFSIKEFN